MTRLAIDIDGVTHDFQGHWIDLYQHWFDREVPVEMHDSWDCLLDGTHFETIDDFYDWFTRANGWQTMPWHPGARGAIDVFDRLYGFDYLYCTNRPKVAVLQTIAALQTPKFIDWHRHPGDKARSKADVWLDDSPAVLRALHEAGKETIRFARPWNQEAPSTHVATSWRDVLDIIDKEYL